MANYLPEGMTRVSYIEDKETYVTLKLMALGQIGRISASRVAKDKAVLSDMIRHATAEFIERNDPTGKTRERAREIIAESDAKPTA